MKSYVKIGLVVALSVGLMLAVVSVASAAPPGAPFAGRWQAMDPPFPTGDGSTNTLTITGGGSGTYRLIWRETFFSLCDGEPGIGMGTGTLSGPTTLSADMVFKCNGEVHPLSPIHIDFEYDSGTDTLTDNSVLTLVWERL